MKLQKLVALISAIAFGIVALAVLTLGGSAGAIPPRHIFSAPVYIQNGSTVLQSFYEDGGGALGASTITTGAINAGGNIISTSNAAFTVQVIEAGPATWTAAGLISDGGIIEYGKPVPPVSQYTGALGAHGLTEKVGTGTLVDGGLIIAFTAGFAYQDGGPPVCTCSGTAAAPTAVACSADPAGASVTLYGTANALTPIAYRCTGPQ